MAKHDLTCVIFAGGKSSRFKSNKALALFEGKRLVHHIYDNMCTCFDEVHVIIKDPSLIDFECTLLLETYDFYAPTAGFLTLFEKCTQEHFFVLSVDTPFINCDVINTIRSTDYEACDAVIARCNGVLHPMCGIYSRKLYDKFLEMMRTDRHSLNKLLQQVTTQCVDIEDESRFFNINTQEEYEEAQRLIKSRDA